MSKAASLLSQLFAIRNRYGQELPTQKIDLISAISREKITTRKELLTWNDSLLFLLAYPDNPAVHRSATSALEGLRSHIERRRNIDERLFNSGITGTRLCAAFSFEIVKWLRKEHPEDISFSSFEADDGQIQSILSVVMPKVESEILQDANANWRSWFRRTSTKGKDVLDWLIAMFDQSDIRPEVKDELWAAIGINVEVTCSSHLSLPSSLQNPYFHRSLIKKKFHRPSQKLSFKKVSLSTNEAGRIIECGRLILVRHLREIDPISFTSAPFVSYYQLERGLSIALTGMVNERRHPIDSYMGYLVFKNGLPVAYAASWVLFDSARIGLNVFPAFRGGESQYIFQQVLKLHQKVYRLNRFTVDPYQLGKENDDGIRSGAFWVYYHAGFRPMNHELAKLAYSESKKIRSVPGYRSPASILRRLANARMELIVHKTAARFDANDLSVAYARIVKERFHSDRELAESASFAQLIRLVEEKNYHGTELHFILKNWCVILLSDELQSHPDRDLLQKLHWLFGLKASGKEEAYIFGMQRTKQLRRLLEKIIERDTASLNA